MMPEQKVQTLTCWTWGCSDYESLREGGEQHRRRRPDITEEEEEEETKAAIGSSLPSIVGAPSVDGGFLYLVPVESQRDLALLEQDLWGFFIGPNDAEVAVQGRVIIRTCTKVCCLDERSMVFRPPFALRTGHIRPPPFRAVRLDPLIESFRARPAFARASRLVLPPVAARRRRYASASSSSFLFLFLHRHFFFLPSLPSFLFFLFETSPMYQCFVCQCFMVTARKEVYSSGKTTENPTELKHDVAYGPYDDVALFPLFCRFYSLCFHDYFPTDIAAYPYCHWKRPVGRGGARSPRPQLETRFRDESAPTTSGVANQVGNPCVTVAHERGQRPWPT
ncbi:hypothetical protein B296_00050231 [Ensete ventricosum]|uniref:Uncharacterized protein n=1 Tax=Ensete ventricosum TaxID=4639 RepID=A0A426YM93_ENSVE|nr:hypothetical protein B296_00050231 [Ensete ventricosum]